MRRAILRLGLCAVLAAVSWFGSGPWERIVEADIRPTSANLDRSGHIARNIIEGQAIAVCTEDLPNAVRAAVTIWNDGLRGRAYIASTSSVFKTSASCQETPADNDIDYIEVVSRSPGDDDFFCRDSDQACFLWPTRSGPPYFTYTGRAVVIINELYLPKTHDRPIDGNHVPGYQPLVRTTTHELGHAPGFGDHECRNQGQHYVISIMECSHSGNPYTLQTRDFEDYSAIFRPRLVVKRVIAGDEKPFAAEASRLPGTVEFNFDASRVFVEESIDIRRWNGLTWVLLKRFGPATGEVTLFIGGQPRNTTQTYMIFSTTQAYLKGQCVVSDYKCDSDNAGAAARIGFGTVAIPVYFTPDPAELGATYDLDLEINGLGSVTVNPPPPYYAGRNTEVALEAVPQTITSDRGLTAGVLPRQNSLVQTVPTFSRSGSSAVLDSARQ